MSGQPRKRPWRHHRLALVVVRGNVASILACVQISSDIICSSFLLLLVYWPVSLPTTCPLYQCITIAYRILVLCASFIVPSEVTVLLCALVNLVNRTASDEITALCYAPQHLKPMRRSENLDF